MVDTYLVNVQNVETKQTPFRHILQIQNLLRKMICN